MQIVCRALRTFKSGAFSQNVIIYPYYHTYCKVKFVIAIKKKIKLNKVSSTMTKLLGIPAILLQKCNAQIMIKCLLQPYKLPQFAPD